MRKQRTRQKPPELTPIQKRLNTWVSSPHKEGRAAVKAVGMGFNVGNARRRSGFSELRGQAFTVSELLPP